MAGGRPQAALHGRRTAPGRSPRPAPGRSPRPAPGPRPLSTAGGRPQVALHSRRAAAPATPADLLKLLPSFLIGLHACRLDLLKNLLIRKNLLLHIATEDNQTL